MQTTSLLIAIVDDEDSVRLALQRLVQSAGMRAVAYASGAEFIAALRTVSPDCVILDLHMPGMSGVDVQLRLNADKIKIPVVVLTGHDTPESHRRAVSAGASAYLRKPVDDQILLDAVASAVSHGKVT